MAKLGVYRRTVIDDGSGMSPDELKKFFATLGEGAKKIGGVHDNFGVGAKIASLPWNPEGVVVISYKEGQASMIWIMLEPDSGDYELVEFDIDGTKSCVIDPSQIGWAPTDVDWATIRPEWLTTHGTIVVMLGSAEYPDTVLGNPNAGERDIKGLSVYLNSRFWDLTGLQVSVAELRSERKTHWPQSREDRENTRRPNNRRILGAQHYVKDIPATAGKLASHGQVPLDEGRVNAEWYLWEGDRPAIHSYAKKPGYIAVRYKDELFELTNSKAHFRWFGIIEGKVQHNLTIILEPQHYHADNGRWGVHPDQSRNRLIFSGNGEKGVALPMNEWGAEFADNLPEQILVAIRAARGDAAGSIEDEEYRKRLQEKFGNRWTVKGMAKGSPSGSSQTAATATDEDIEVFDRPGFDGERGTRRRHRKTVKVLHKRATASGDDFGVERDVPVDVPRYRISNASEFDKPWHLALWAPNDPDGPTVLINADSPILDEIVKYHQEQYPDHFAEEVGKTVRNVFGEIAACKIAHSQKLAKHVAIQELDAEYRSEQSLTIALMGLLAEEAVIAQRLGRLGRKRTATPTLVVAGGA